MQSNSERILARVTAIYDGGGDEIEDEAHPAPTPVALPDIPRRGGIDPRLEDVLNNSKAKNTWRAYASDWRIFEAYCQRIGRRALPAEVETVCLFLTDQANRGLAWSTIERRTASINQRHLLAGHDSPTKAPLVHECKRGIMRDIGTAQTRKAPLGIEDMAKLRFPQTTVGIRDRAMILIGWLGVLRRSEIVAIQVEDLSITPEGLTLIIRRSKTDQEGHGEMKFIPRLAYPLDAVAAVERWLSKSGLVSGPLFVITNTRGVPVRGVGLKDRKVARIVKRLAKQAGLDPDIFSGHSLRAGGITALAKAGAPIHEIMQHSGHRVVETVMKYIRPAVGMESSPLHRLNRE